jgi:hypothetical protein
MAAMLPIPALFTQHIDGTEGLDSRGDYGLDPARGHIEVLVPHVIAKLRGEGATIVQHTSAITTRHPRARRPGVRGTMPRAPPVMMATVLCSRGLSNRSQ